jgi:general secretion pathway protein J
MRTASFPRRARQQAFTLVEVLVAMLVMAVMAGMAWQGIEGISRSRSTTEAHMEHTLRVNTVLAQWAQDLQMLYDTPLVPTLSFDGATLRLVRSSDDGVQVVAWALRGRTWMRWTGPVVGRHSQLQESWIRSQQLLGNEPNQLRALEGVSGVQVYFYRRNGWSNAQSTGDLQMPTPTLPGMPPVGQPSVELPNGVRLVMSFIGGQAGMPAGTLTRDVALAMQNR